MTGTRAFWTEPGETERYGNALADCVTVPLHGKKANGRVALVDAEDYDLVMQYHWWVWEVPEKNWGPYPQAKIGAGHKAPRKYMHQLLTGWPLTDHRNHNGLDNRRENLRDAGRAQNVHNQRPIRGGSSSFKGVHLRRDTLRWEARITSSGSVHVLGSFDSDVDAALAYDAAARHYFGEYCCPNFPEAAGVPVRVSRPALRRCAVCHGPIDPIDYCGKCADIAQKCDEHPRPRRRIDSETCSKKCQNARRFLVGAAPQEVANG
jgi:hypothetical protein